MVEQSLLDVKANAEAALFLTSPTEQPIHLARERRHLSLLSIALRLWFRRCYWRSAWRVLAFLCTCARRPQFNRFSFECAVSILPIPIRTAGFFVLGNVLHGRSFSTLGDRGLVCDLEDAGFLFSGDRECLSVLVRCRDHSVKWDRPCALLRWRSDPEGFRGR